MGVRACHEALIMAPLRTVDLPFVSAELVYLVWRTYVEQRESSVRTADCKHARALAPRERADAHPVGIWPRPRPYTAPRSRVPHLYAARCGPQLCVQLTQRAHQ